MSYNLSKYYDTGICDISVLYHETNMYMWIAIGKYLFPAEHWLYKLRSMKTKAPLGLFGTVCVFL